MPSVMPGTVPGAMPGTVPNGPFAPDRMNATAYAPTESKRRKPAGPIVVLSILGLTFLSFAGLMGLIWVNDMGIIGIMRLGTIWIAAVCIVMGLVVIILGFRGRRTGGLIPLGLVAGGCALCMTIVSGTYGVYYRQRHQYCCFTEPICQCEKQRRHERCAKGWHLRCRCQRCHV